jgi:murein DD-endopeptidase MepM/ murein hydrolase activator NlpD
MDPFNKKKRFHTGVDLAAETGTPVRALADGVVTYTTDNFEEAKGSGKVVVVEHGDGWTTRYYHLDGWAVRQGTTVSAGETIGAVGNTGRSTGPHLHFEILRDGEQVNPAEFVRLGN